jgi:hypothetical protein
MPESSRQSLVLGAKSTVFVAADDGGLGVAQRDDAVRTDHAVEVRLAAAKVDRVARALKISGIDAADNVGAGIVQIDRLVMAVVDIVVEVMVSISNQKRFTTRELVNPPDCLDFEAASGFKMGEHHRLLHTPLGPIKPLRSPDTGILDRS